VRSNDVGVDGNILPAANAKQGGASGANADDVNIADAVKILEQNIQQTRREIKFEFHEKLGTSVVTVLDQETKQVIRQFPSEEVIAMAERIVELSDDSGGKLFRTIV